MNTHASLFVALEGIDNAGKTSLLDDVRREFSSHIPVHVTRELTTDVGRLLLAKLQAGKTNTIEKVLLFAADRHTRLELGFRDLLETPSLCIADRWVLSAQAYRCAEEPDIADYVRAVNAPFPSPDLTVLIDITAATSITRGAPLDKNNHSSDYLDSVRLKYLEIARSVHAIVLDGHMEYGQLAGSLIQILRERLGAKGLLN
jgi:dTMP kinase